MEILEFLKSNWLIVLIALVVVILLVRAMFKLALVALVVGGILVFAFGFTPGEVWQFGKGAWNNVAGVYEKTVQPVLEKELEGAQVAVHPDGRFVIKTESVEVTGTKNSETVVVRYKDKEMEVDISVLGNVIQEQIERIQQQMSAEQAPSL